MQLNKASKNKNGPIVIRQFFSLDGRLRLFQMWDGSHRYESHPQSKEREDQITRRDNWINDWLLRSGRSVTHTPPSRRSYILNNADDPTLAVISTYEFPVVEKTFTAEVRLSITLPEPLCDLISGTTNLYTPVPSFSEHYNSEYTKQWNLIVDQIMRQLNPEDIEKILFVEEN